MTRNHFRGSGWTLQSWVSGIYLFIGEGARARPSPCASPLTPPPPTPHSDHLLVNFRNAFDPTATTGAFERICVLDYNAANTLAKMPAKAIFGDGTNGHKSTKGRANPLPGVLRRGRRVDDELHTTCVYSYGKGTKKRWLPKIEYKMKFICLFSSLLYLFNLGI
ncbi:hypothetical protein T492DRAFT_480028 [Pavlovales sp. CCMP2436]|nr:hypothetical protein T492DRAFT_480028 [Pavlovales sp. CCMP2436]